MYDLYLDGVMYPIAPSKVQMKIGNNNKTITLVNESDVNILKAPGLKEISFDVLLPNVQYPFAVYPNGFQRAEYYINLLEALKTGKKQFQFILGRKMPQGTNLHNTNLTVSLEDVSFTDDTNEGFDIKASIKLKEWRHYGTKVITIANETVSITEQRTPLSNAPQSGNYTVQKGDTLWKIAKKFYDDGSKYPVIHNANKDKIDNPNLIYPGQVLVIPNASAGQSIQAQQSTQQTQNKISYKPTGGKMSNSPFSVITSDGSPIKTNIATWNEAYGYYVSNGGKDRKWKMLDGSSNAISM